MVLPFPPGWYRTQRTEAPTNDQDAVLRARAGDEEAFATLVARHRPAAHRTAWLLGAGDDAEDAVQEAFAKAFRHLDRFREAADFKPWLLSIVANETRNLRRSGLRRAAREDFVRNGVAMLDRSPEEAALASATREGLLAAVKGLPERDRAVIVCRYFLDLSEAETADVLGLPRGTVKSRHARALAKLRRVAVAAAVLIAALGAATAVSPRVRAAVERVFHFAGIEVHTGAGRPAGLGTPPASASGSASPTYRLPGERTVDLATARALAAFPITVPGPLGPPETTTISDGGRVVSLFYRHGTVRLDEFDGRLAPYFAKYAVGDGGQQVTVGGAAAWWIPGHQDVVYLDRSGHEVTATAHIADGTLIWQTAGVSLRLEGISDASQAIAAAS